MSCPSTRLEGRAPAVRLASRRAGRGRPRGPVRDRARRGPGNRASEIGAVSGTVNVRSQTDCVLGGTMGHLEAAPVGEIQCRSVCSDSSPSHSDCRGQLVAEDSRRRSCGRRLPRCTGLHHPDSRFEQPDPPFQRPRLVSSPWTTAAMGPSRECSAWYASVFERRGSGDQVRVRLGLAPRSAHTALRYAGSPATSANSTIGATHTARYRAVHFAHFFSAALFAWSRWNSSMMKATASATYGHHTDAPMATPLASTEYGGGGGGSPSSGRGGTTVFFTPGATR